MQSATCYPRHGLHVSFQHAPWPDWSHGTISNLLLGNPTALATFIVLCPIRDMLVLAQHGDCVAQL